MLNINVVKELAYRITNSTDLELPYTYVRLDETTTGLLIKHLLKNLDEVIERLEKNSNPVKEIVIENETVDYKKAYEALLQRIDDIKNENFKIAKNSAYQYFENKNVALEMSVKIRKSVAEKLEEILKEFPK